MNRVLLIVAAVVLVAPPLAEARRWGTDFGPVLQAQGPTKKGEPPRGGRNVRGAREGRPPQGDERHQGRMTDEERRGLHQDLDRANREIYKPAPRR